VTLTDPSDELILVPVYLFPNVGKLDLVAVLYRYGGKVAEAVAKLNPGESTRVQLASYEDGASVWTSYEVKRLGGAS
jgi:hypothetical protein